VRGARRGRGDDDGRSRRTGPRPVEVRQGLRHQVRAQERQARARPHARLLRRRRRLHARRPRARQARAGLQVWAVDRRSEALEDTSRFKDALAGRISAQQALDYYLGWLTDPAQQPRFQPLDQAQFGFAKQWGLSLALQDVRRVVLSARRQGKRVILGGHSLGASMTVAYASWDFGGHPGYEDLDGLVLIDGGLLGSFSTPNLAATKKRSRSWTSTVRSPTCSDSSCRGPPASSRRSARSRR
jgi:hypothetical protein